MSYQCERQFYKGEFKVKRNKFQEELAMEINKRFVIKTYRAQAVCGDSQRYAMWCGGCGANVVLASLNEAASIARTNANDIINYAADGKIHLGVCPAKLLFCLKSVLRVKDCFPLTATGN